jgi:diguanylate cyclase (GGDEF)-like protein/PAS domain S-box-containing protein
MAEEQDAVQTPDRGDGAPPLADLLEAIDAIPGGFVLYDRAGRLLHCNRAFRTFHADVADALVPGAHFIDLLRAETETASWRAASGSPGGGRRCGVDCGPVCAEWIACCSETHAGLRSEMYATTADGRWMRIDEHRTPNGLVVGLRTDLSDLRDVQRQLHQSEAKFRTLFAMAPVGIVRTTADGRIVDANPAFAVITGSSPDDLRPLADLFDPRDRAAVTGDLAQGFSEARYGPVERRMVGPDGRELVLSMEGTRAVDGDGAPFVWSILQDVTERRRAEAQIRHAAHHDTLTGLPNRKHLAEVLEGLLVEEKPVALLLVDLDNFKAVNDSFGHEAGDFVLVEAARRLRDGVRDQDVVARLGGDEFAVVIGGPIAESEVVACAERLVEALNRHVVGRGRAIRVGASIGLALAPEHGREGDAVLRSADHALLEAKRAGRNRVVVFTPELFAVHRRLGRLGEQIRRALAENRVVPHYQPIVHLESGYSRGFEALCRVETSAGWVTPPMEAFRDPDLGRALDERMIDRVLADLVRWRTAGLDVGRVHVNVGEARFGEERFVDDLLGRLDRAGLEPASIGLEVTETILLDLASRALPARLERLRGAGVSVALDDFGTGHASLTHLKALPVDRVKIDRSFVADVIFDPASRAIVEALVRLGRGLGKEVVAEGIETAGQWRAVVELGCRLGQGHFFSKAIAAGAVPAVVGAPDRHVAGAVLGKSMDHLR